MEAVSTKRNRREKVNKESFFTIFHNARIKEHPMKLSNGKFKTNKRNIQVNCGTHCHVDVWMLKCICSKRNYSWGISLARLIKHSIPNANMPSIA